RDRRCRTQFEIQQPSAGSEADVLRSIRAVSAIAALYRNSLARIIGCPHAGGAADRIGSFPRFDDSPCTSTGGASRSITRRGNADDAFVFIFWSARVITRLHRIVWRRFVWSLSAYQRNWNSNDARRDRAFRGLDGAARKSDDRGVRDYRRRGDRAGID